MIYLKLIIICKKVEVVLHDAIYKSWWASCKSVFQKAYDDVRLRVKKGQKEIIQKRAEELNKSVNSYIVDLIEEDLKEIR